MHGAISSDCQSAQLKYLIMDIHYMLKFYVSEDC